ncbi:MAG: fluoride efflux transporter CrcB [Bacteroidales bacterium]
MIKILLLVGSGSFLGGIARYLTSRYIQHVVMTAFPFGTFVVNILGCFIIGILYGLSEKGSFMSVEYRLFLTAGFCGGFTTFSTFSQENLALFKDGNIFIAALYISGSVFFSLLATYLGNILVKSF